MCRVNVFCEGQTEETFVRELLYDYFISFNIWLNPIVLKTSKTGRGGVVSYQKVRDQVVKKCKQDTDSIVTTLLDLYGLPNDFPGVKVSGESSFDQANRIERELENDISCPNFIANIVVHEFEAFLFSRPDVFGNWFDDPCVVDKLTAIRNGVTSPEDINNGLDTAPSKRIMKACRGYDKVVHGSVIALDIGLDTIRSECGRFDNWIGRIANRCAS